MLKRVEKTFEREPKTLWLHLSVQGNPQGLLEGLMAFLIGVREPINPFSEA